ncbi:MAG: hypothetical protein M3R36_06130 [Bacteroidota bacterium]|nr:hypothetical protein [Bacteroidota bacterium]
MKKIFLFIMISSSLAFAQRNRSQYYGTIGFGFLLPNTDQINQILNHYNQTKINLYEPFDDFEMIYGPDLEFGVIFDKQESAIVLEFGFSIKFSSTKSAKNVETNFARKKIDINMKFPSLNVGGQYLYKVSKSFDIGAGIYINFGSISILNRSYNIGSSPPVYRK